MALGRLDLPGRDPLQRHDLPRHVQGRGDRRGDRLRGDRRLPGRQDQPRASCTRSRTPRAPAPGACGGQYTANTMSTVMEFVGLSPAGLNGIPAEDPDKDAAARAAASWSWTCRATTSGRRSSSPGRPSRTASRPWQRPAAARTASCTCWPSRTSSASRSTSTSSAPSPTGRRRRRHAPGGRFTASDMYDAGGVALVMRELLKRDLLHGEQPHRRRPHDRPGRERRPRRPPASRSSSRSSAPLKPVGGLTILRGTLAPRAASSSWPATNAGSTAARPGCSTRRARASRRVRRRRSSPATWSSSATRARSAVPACRRCSPSPARSWARAWATRSRS